MLDITEQNLSKVSFYVEIQLALYLIIISLVSLMIVRLCNMEIIYGCQQKQQFYQNYTTHLKDGCSKILQRVTASKLQILEAPLSEMPSNETPPPSSQSSLESAASKICNEATQLVPVVPVSSSFINEQPHRTCDTCRQYKKDLKEAKGKKHLVRQNTYTGKSNTAAPTEDALRKLKEEAMKEVMATLGKDFQKTLNNYENFIEQMMKDYDKVKVDKEIITIHVNNLSRAFDNLQAQYQQAKEVVSGFERNEKILLAQLSKYDNLFQMMFHDSKAPEDTVQLPPMSKSTLLYPTLERLSTSTQHILKQKSARGLANK